LHFDNNESAALALTPNYSDGESRRRRMRKRVRELARNVVAKPLSYVAPLPQVAVGAVLRDATIKAVDKAVEEVMHWRRMRKRVREPASNVVAKPFSYVAPFPQAVVATALRDATIKVVDMAVEEVMHRRTTGGGGVGENENASSLSSPSSSSSLDGM
jgi:hypothetical protein